MDVMRQERQVNETNTILSKLLTRYRNSSRPISVTFRQMIGSLSNGDRATHLLHPYPAKLLMHIPYFFLANDILSKPHDTILDPFCGSGTVLLEAMLAGRNAVGCDTNPLARLIAKVKISPLETLRLRQSIDRLYKRIPDKPQIDSPDVVNLKYWFHPHVINQLLRLLEAINSTRDDGSKAFFQVCFSNCVRRVSLADPRLSVPVRLRYGQYPEKHWLREKTDQHLSSLSRVNVIRKFSKLLEENYKRMVLLNEMLPSGVKAEISSSDARSIYGNSKQNGPHSRSRKIRAKSVDMILTSPPYASAQKYIRASSLSLGWLGLCGTNELRKLEDMTLGREFYPKDSYTEPLKIGIRSVDNLLKELHHVNPLRSHIAGNYLIEMGDSIEEMARVLKDDGYMILVVANSQVCGREFKTQEWLTNIAKEYGFSLKLKLIDDIRSRGLMTKRNNTASLITREWMLVFQKDHRANGRI